MRARRSVLAAAFLILALAFGWVGFAYAQSATATILGTVSDPQGNSVPDASVVAKNVDTGIERTTTTTTDGLYRLPNLPPGDYDVSVEKAGFSKAVAKGVHINVGDQRDVNFKLALATVATEVKVTAETPLIETTKTDTSLVIDETEMSHLPVLNVGAFNTGTSPMNDYAGLAATAPGVRFDLSGNSSDLLGPGAYNNRGNLVNVDGGNISDQVVSSRDALGASLNEVKEFQVITNNYNAEYGQAGNIIINVVTKSGTNTIHGSANAFFRGRNLAASNFFYNEFNPDAAFRRAPFQKQIWGFDSGGPIVKDKTFWYVNYVKAQQAVPLTLQNQPPSFTQSVTVSQPTNEILWTVKLDHELFKNHHLMLRFNADRQFFDNDLVQVPQFAQPESLTLSAFHDHTFNIGLTSAITPRVVNEARFFWHRFINILPTKSTAPGVRTANTYSGAAFCCPQGGLQNRYQYIDNITWTRGTHTIKSGVNISHFPYFSLFQQFHFGEWDTRNSTLTVGFGPGAVNASDTIYGLYVQDSWKLRPNLTFNYGVRYDYEDGAFKGGTIAARGGKCFQGNGIISSCSSDGNNFQPRVGIAWSPHYESGFLHTLFGDPGRSVIRISAAEVTELAYLNVVLDSLNFDGVTLLTASIATSSTCPGGATVQSFFPNLPPASCLATFRPANFFGRVRPIAPDLHNPETRHLSFDFTRQFGKDIVVGAGYVGVLGFGQFGENDQNFPAIIPDTRAGVPAGFFYLGPRPDPRFRAIRTNTNSRTSAYHGLLIHGQKKFSQHFQAQGSYTFSKLLASTEDFYGTSEPGDPRNIHGERGLSQNDVRHLGTFSFVYDTQKLTAIPVASQIINNWSFGVIGLLQSGRPYPISTGEGPFTGSVFPGVGAETQQRPNVLPDGTLVATNIASNSGANLAVGAAPGTALGSPSPNCGGCPVTTFFAPTSGANPASPGGPVDSFATDSMGNPILDDFQFLNGNVARGAGRGDPLYRFDLSLTKTIPIHERFSVDLRANIINVFNRRNFILFNNNDTLDFFSISTDPACVSCIRAAGPLQGRYIGSDGRVLHLSDLQHGRVSRDLKNPLFAGVGDPLSTDFPRTVELGLVIRW
jgi:carboxypeptidase family protein/TonB-dependent receptor-like protein